jgi:hypothetical protein
MLKALTACVLRARRQKAAWERWARKQPHNRVRRPVLRDEAGQVVGHGPPEPMPEPPIDPVFCRKVELPSGKVVVQLLDHDIEAAYRQARHPAAKPEEVRPLLIPEEQVAGLYRQACGERPPAQA